MDTKNLVKALQEQEDNLQMFLDSLLKHQKALIEHDLPVMNEAIIFEGKIIKDITALDKEILKTMHHLSEQYSLRLASTKLLDFTKAIKKMSTNDYVSLLQLQKSIRKLLVKIKTVNSQNSMLIMNARNFIKQTFSSLVGVNKDPILDRRV
ncbi:MAG: flagellar export chaperone FlgN [Ignavibacteriaceae bacterium]|jgi:hypothetical protein